MKKDKKAPKKTAAASKAKPAPAAVKKPVKAAAQAKPAAKGKVPEKAKAAPEKSDKKPMTTLKKGGVAPPMKKEETPPPAIAAKDVKKTDKVEKPAAPAAAPSKTAAAKASVESKISVGRKVESSAATAKGASASKTSSAIKVEPKIIEMPQPERHVRQDGEQLFTKEDIEAFRQTLNGERTKILQKARQVQETGAVQIDKDEMMDEVDQASAMIEQNLTFRLLDRDRKLLSEIDAALVKLDSGDFGYCEGTGEPIPKRRLELRPWCRYSVKYKERLERMEKSGRGVVDEDEL